MPPGLNAARKTPGLPVWPHTLMSGGTFHIRQPWRANQYAAAASPAVPDDRLAVIRYLKSKVFRTQAVIIRVTHAACTTIDGPSLSTTTWPL